MEKRIKLVTAEDLREFMNIAWNSPHDVGVHAPDGKIADAKSILGLMALDYAKPVMVVTDDARFLSQIKKWIVED